MARFLDSDQQGTTERISEGTCLVRVGVGDEQDDAHLSGRDELGLVELRLEHGLLELGCTGDLPAGTCAAGDGPRCELDPGDPDPLRRAGPGPDGLDV